MPRNVPSPLRGDWAIFLDRRATTCPVAEERAKYFLARGPRPIFIRCHAVSRRRKECLEAFQDVPLREAQAMLLHATHAAMPGTGVRLYTCPVAAKIAPDILGRGTKVPFSFLASCISSQYFVLYKILQRWTQEHLDGLAECLT